MISIIGSGGCKIRVEGLSEYFRPFFLWLWMIQYLLARFVFRLPYHTSMCGWSLWLCFVLGILIRLYYAGN